MDEDKYEYAVRRIDTGQFERTYIVGNFWSDKEDRQSFIDALLRVTPETHTYKLVRRRKAGPEEEVEN